MIIFSKKEVLQVVKNRNNVIGCFLRWEKSYNYKEAKTSSKGVFVCERKKSVYLGLEKV